jgi:hypothetical protein
MEIRWPEYAHDHSVCLFYVVDFLLTPEKQRMKGRRMTASSHIVSAHQCRLVWVQLVRGRTRYLWCYRSARSMPCSLVPRTGSSFPLTLRCRHVYATTLWRHQDENLNNCHGGLGCRNFARLLLFWWYQVSLTCSHSSVLCKVCVHKKWPSSYYTRSI